MWIQLQMVINIQVGNSCELPWIHCNFFTKPKIKLTVYRPHFLAKGYPKKPKCLGERLKKQRLDMGLLQKDIAKIIGVSTDTITYWEQGRTHSCRKNLEKVMNFLDNSES